MGFLDIILGLIKALFDYIFKREDEISDKLQAQLPAELKNKSSKEKIHWIYIQLRNWFIESVLPLYPILPGYFSDHFKNIKGEVGKYPDPFQHICNVFNMSANTLLSDCEKRKAFLDLIESPTTMAGLTVEQLAVLSSTDKFGLDTIDEWFGQQYKGPFHIAALTPCPLNLSGIQSVVRGQGDLFYSKLGAYFSFIAQGIKSYNQWSRAGYSLLKQRSEALTVGLVYPMLYDIVNSPDVHNLQWRQIGYDYYQVLMAQLEPREDDLFG